MSSLADKKSNIEVIYTYLGEMICEEDLIIFLITDQYLPAKLVFFSFFLFHLRIYLLIYSFINFFFFFLKTKLCLLTISMFFPVPNIFTTFYDIYTVSWPDMRLRSSDLLWSPH